MPKKPDAAAELSAKMTEALEAQRARGAADYPIPLGRLREAADPTAPPELALKALGKPPLAQRAVVAQKKNLAAPVVLREDLEQLVASPQVLGFALEALYAAGPPPWPLKRLSAQLDKSLRGAFEAAVARRLAENSLPETVAVIDVRGKPALYLKQRPPPEVELAEKLVEALRRQRERGDYPLPLKRLAELTDPAAPPDLVSRAATQPAFLAAALPAAKNHPEAPVALREDADRLAGSPAVLHFALRSACTEAAPTVTVAKLKARLDAPLRGAFEAAVTRQIAEGTLPADVEWLPRAKALHPRWLPLPKAPEVELAERLVRVLESQRRLGSEAYPVRLRRLVELSGAAPSAKVLAKGLSVEPFATRAIPLLLKHTDSPVALIEDVEAAAGHAGLVALLLDAARTDKVQAFSAAELKARVAKPAQAAFAHALDGHLEAGSLPRGVGWIGTKKERLLFRIEDVRGARPLSPSAAAAPPAPADFETAFEEAFARLDRAGGSHNFVSLVELRQALPCDRSTFDASLRRLRAAGRYTLSAAEGRHGVSEEERAAGVMEEGTLLLFASRR